MELRVLQSMSLVRRHPVLDHPVNNHWQKYTSNPKIGVPFGDRVSSLKEAFHGNDCEFQLSD